jgi:sugar fermentation stimulation protein A
MMELLLPGRTVLLEQSGHTSRRTASGKPTGRKTRYTLAAVIHREQIIPLVSTTANLIARELIVPRKFPGASQIRGEVPHGRSRFDLGFCWDGARWLVEVKACTLVHDGLALFPDAPTLRGTRHLQELAALPPSLRGGVLIVVFGESAAAFGPNPHTDPQFASTLLDLPSDVPVCVSSVVTDRAGMSRVLRLDLPIEEERIRNTLQADSGVYAVLVTLEEGRTIQPGALGPTHLEAGTYVYVGSAMRGLNSRLARHRRKRKRMRWHVDWLTAVSDRTRVLPIRTNRALECHLAGSVSRLSSGSLRGFGCSDCRCDSHLFFFPKDPLSDPRFVAMILDYRHTVSLGR